MAALRPEPEGFEQLYRRHRGSVYRFLLRNLSNPAEAEDATQTAFMQAYRAYTRGTRPERPHAWLITIADNLRKRAFRTRERRSVEVALDEAAIPDVRGEVDVREIREALETLPSNQRSALVLREVAGLSYGEIADHLRVSVGSVQMLLFRARKTLRGELASARRGLFPVPGWLANLLSGTDRLVTLRTAGAALVAATTAGVAVTGAEPAQRVATGEHHRPPAAAERTPAHADVTPAPRADVRAPRSTLPNHGLPAGELSAGTEPAPTAAAQQPASGAEPAAPPALVPKTPATPPPQALPLPELPLPQVQPPPLPALPVQSEGALDPQQLGVLAGR
jgi:RNA polymerase sigma-70 factor, ECF subfamily